MSYTTETMIAAPSERSPAVSPAIPTAPAGLELFSYGVCCLLQGAVWVAYLGIIVFVPLALRHGLF